MLLQHTEGICLNGLLKSVWLWYSVDCSYLSVHPSLSISLPPSSPSLPQSSLFLFYHYPPFLLLSCRLFQSHAAQACLELSVKLKMTLNILSLYLNIPSDWIADTCHHTWFGQCLRLNEGLHACWASIMLPELRAHELLILPPEYAQHFI